MIKVKLFWRKMGSEYLIGVYDFGNDKTEALIKALNSISDNPIDPQDILERWPLGRQARSYKAPRGGSQFKENDPWEETTID